MYYNKPMTKDTTSDLDKTKNSTNSTMLTCCFFDNNDQENKKKLVFDCAQSENQISEIISIVLQNKKWVKSD